MSTTKVKSMRILFYYSGNLDLNRGTPNRARNIIKFVAKKEEVIVAASKLTIDNSLPKIRFLHLKKHSYFTGINFVCKLRELKNIVKTVQPDIIYGFTNNSTLVLGTITRLLKIPSVVEMHDPDFRKRTIFNNLISFLENIALKNITGIVTISEKLKSYYLKLLKNSRLNTKVIYGGADVNLFNPNIKPSKSLHNIKKKRHVLVGYIGNFRYYQGIDFLIEVAKKIQKKDFSFILIGGETEKEIKRMRMKIKKNNLGNQIHILGEKKYDQIPSYLSGMDILVVPRPSLPITEYAFPSKISEYMAMGKPIISTDVGGAKEIIKNQVNGILIPSERIGENLAKALLFLKENPKLREKIGKNAYEHIKNNLNWDILTDQLISFLKKILIYDGK